MKIRHFSHVRCGLLTNWIETNFYDVHWRPSNSLKTLKLINVFLKFKPFPCYHCAKINPCYNMYYPIGWPKLLDSQKAPLRLATDKVKILFAVLHEKSVALWFCKPCVPITYHQRSDKCIVENGTNAFIEWKIDSSKLVVAVSIRLIVMLMTWMVFVVKTTHFNIHIFPQTNDGALIIYDVQVDDDSTGGLYTQNDSPFNYLRRDSAELFIKETIPSLKLNLVRCAHE